MTTPALNLPATAIKALTDLCRKYHVRELALFGSAVRGELTAGSDLDFLVEFQPQAHIGFLALSGLSRELSSLLHRPVDLVPKAGLKPALRGQVLAEVEVVYAA